MSGELKGLTGLRGLAAWWVVLYHLRSGLHWTLPAPLYAALSKGYLAVDLFFMLSGFVLWLAYADRLRTEGLAAAPRFLARRLARIWPLHLVILAGAAALALALELSGRPDAQRFPWHELPLHLLLVQNWGFTERLSWNDPAWSISCEWAAYLLFPLLTLAVDWRRCSTPLLIATIGGLMLGLHLIFAAAGADRLGDAITTFGVPRALIEFLIGTLLCTLWLRWRERPQRALIACVVLAMGAAMAWALGVVGETLAVPALLAALLLAIALSPAKLLASRPLHYLGEISYSTYLVHFLLFVVVKLVMVDDPARVALPVALFYLASVLAASAILFHAVERPAQRRLNAWIDSRLQARPDRNEVRPRHI